MRKYLVFTMSKTTEEINFKYIEADEPDSDVIEDYIYSMGDVVWAVYPPSVSYYEAVTNFDKYTYYYFRSHK